MSYERVIRGRIVLPDSVVDGGWVAVEGGKIAAVGVGPAPAAGAVEDYGDAYVFPGFVDGQVHACSYAGYKGITSTTRSAIAGGITTIVDMPYDNPQPLNSMAVLADKLAVVKSDAMCDVALYGTVAPGQGTTEMAPLAEAGICAFKLSAFESNPVRFPRIPPQEIADILRASVPLGLPVGLHNEDQEMVNASIARFKAEGRTKAADHAASRPVEAELISTAQFLELGSVTGAHVHIVHISTPLGYQLVRNFRENGTRATAEMCVHYLHFDAAEAMPRLGAKLKVNPPIRDGVVEGLWMEMDEDDIVFTSSDHSSWPIDNKFTESIFDAGAGIPGLETLVRSFFTDVMARDEDPVPQVREQLAAGPARFFGLADKGEIRPGMDADFAVLKLEGSRFDASKNHDELTWSPYDGEQFGVSVAATYLRGKLAWDGKNILGAPGDGRYVARTGPAII